MESGEIETRADLHSQRLQLAYHFLGTGSSAQQDSSGSEASSACVEVSVGTRETKVSRHAAWRAEHQTGGAAASVPEAYLQGLVEGFLFSVWL